jgi:ABC-type branched-subunit amino acid transport system substrate-binding protein
MLPGAAQAQSVINERGGIDGKLPKLVAIDDSDDPKAAAVKATFS